MCDQEVGLRPDLHVALLSGAMVTCLFTVQKKLHLGWSLLNVLKNGVTCGQKTSTSGHWRTSYGVVAPHPSKPRGLGLYFLNPLAAKLPLNWMESFKWVPRDFSAWKWIPVHLHTSWCAGCFNPRGQTSFPTAPKSRHFIACVPRGFLFCALLCGCSFTV